MTTFVDVPTICRIVDRVGLVQFIAGMEATMSEDFRRWEEFDKCPRVASHSDLGVVELMPVGNGS